MVFVYQKWVLRTFNYLIKPILTNINVESDQCWIPSVISNNKEMANVEFPENNIFLITKS